MNGSVRALLDAARSGLREAVRPEMLSDHARAQLAAVMDILAKLARMSDWAPVIVREERNALEAAIADVESRAAAAGLSLPPGRAGDDRSAACRDRIRQLSDWVFEAVPPGDVRNQLDAALRAGLRAAVGAERRHVPSTDFSAMTEAKDN